MITYLISEKHTSTKIVISKPRTEKKHFSKILFIPLLPYCKLLLYKMFGTALKLTPVTRWIINTVNTDVINLIHTFF